MQQNSTTTPRLTQNEAKTGILVLVLMALIPMFVMFIETMVVPALITISSEFSSQSQWVSWVISSVLLVGAVATPVIGKLGDIHGRKKIFMIVLSVYFLGVIGAGFSWDMFSLIFFRAMQGVGLGLFPLAYCIVRDCYADEPKLLGLGLGLISGMFAVGSALGLVAGGYIISVSSWRTCFLIMVPVFAILAGGVLFFVKDQGDRQPGKLDINGAFLLGLSIFSLILGLTLSEGGELSAGIIFLFGVSVCSLVVFGRYEKKVENPLINLKLLKHKPLLLANIASIFGGFCMLGLYQVIPFFLEAPSVGYNIEDPFFVGLFLVPMAISILLFSLLGSKIIEKKHGILILLGGLCIVTAGFVLLSFWSLSTTGLLISTAVIGVGLGLSFVSMIDTITKYSSKADFGQSSSMNSLFRTIGGSIGPVTASLVLASFRLPEGTGTAQEGFILFWNISALVAFIGVIIALLFLWDRKRDESRGKLIAPASE